MVALQIRDVPEDLRARLAAIASERGQSLQAYLFDVLSDEARRRDNLATIERFSAKRYGTTFSADDITGTLREGRAERDGELGTSEAGN